MASNLVVKVHPVVYMSIIDSFIRSTTPAKPDHPACDKVLGTLLGYYEKGVIQVTNCFSIPFSESTDCVELDVTFNDEMISLLNRASPAEKPVGWFYTTSCLSSNCIIYHEYYNRVVKASWMRTNVPSVLLTIDTSFSGPENVKYRLPVRAFVRSYAGIPGNTEPHCVFFNPFPVEMDAFPGERIALQLLQTTLDCRKRETHLGGEMEHLNKNIENMIEWLKYILKYVKGVVAKKKFTADNNTGRQIMEIVNTVAANLPKEKLDTLVKNSVRDYSVIKYLADLLHSHLNIYEQLYCQE